MSAPGMFAPPVTPVRWRPTWAVVVAVLGVLVMLGVLWVGGGMVLSGLPGFSGDPSTAYAAIGVFVGAPILVLGLAGLVPLIWFLVQGGRTAFTIGAVLSGLALGFFAMLLLFLLSSL